MKKPIANRKLPESLLDSIHDRAATIAELGSNALAVAGDVRRVFDASAHIAWQEQVIADQAAELTRLRWQHDTPGNDLPGIIRRGSIGSIPVIVVRGINDEKPWMRLTVTDAEIDHWFTHQEVRGWDRVGVVPFTPAADALTSAPAVPV